MIQCPSGDTASPTGAMPSGYGTHEIGVAGGESSPGTWAGIWECAISMATPASPDNATQIVVARLDTDGHSFRACSRVPGGCRGRGQVAASLDELDVPEAAASLRVIAGLRRSWR